ncbi:MAG: CoA-binding protein, partial [Planctomycetota bacterium]|nr:CoA-binding protein [Planctomycetota bacterium]
MSMESFFNPKSVAVVGASRQKGKTGYEILAALVRGGFPGPIFPINPKAPEVEGLPCFPDLKSLPVKPDLVVIVVPAPMVAASMEECVSLGVKSVVIITAGFKEAGEEGRKLEQAVVEIARRGGIRVVGPNCLGVMVPINKLNASFGGDLPGPGGIGYISQSGALLAAILDMARSNDMGFSMLISIGNKADLNELDFIDAMAEHEGTKVIAGYLEN